MNCSKSLILSLALSLEIEDYEYVCFFQDPDLTVCVNLNF